MTCRKIACFKFRSFKAQCFAGILALGACFSLISSLSARELELPVIEIDFAGLSQFQRAAESTPLARGLTVDSASTLLNNTGQRLSGHWAEKLTGSADSDEQDLWSQWIQLWALRPWSVEIFADDSDQVTAWTLQIGATMDEALEWSRALRNSLDHPSLPLPFDRKYSRLNGWRLDSHSNGKSLHCVASESGLALSWETISGEIMESSLVDHSSRFGHLPDENLIQLTVRPSNWHWLNDWIRQWSDADYTLTVRVIQESNFFRALGSLEWGKAVELSEEPWIFPVDLIRDPLIQLTAMRLGEGSRLSEDFLKPLGYSETPTQAFTWSMPGNPMQTFLTFPSSQTLEELKEWTPALAETLSRWIKPLKLGVVNASEDQTKAIWSGFPFNLPFVGMVDSEYLELGSGWKGGEPEADKRKGFVMAGFFPPNLSPQPAPQPLLQQFSGNEKIVYYSWELTSLEMKKWGQYFQLVDMISKQRPDPETIKKLKAEGKSLESLNQKNAAVDWILAMEKQFGNTITVWEMDSPEVWTLNRKAPAIFSGFELAYLLRTLGGADFPEPARYIPRNTPLPRPEGRVKPMFFYTNPKTSSSKPATKNSKSGLSKPR